MFINIDGKATCNRLKTKLFLEQKPSLLIDKQIFKYNNRYKTKHKYNLKNTRINHTIHH